MRCGPSYDLNGSLANGQLSSVVLDGLSGAGVAISQPSPGILSIEISQAFDNSGANSQPIVTRGYAAVASFQ
jgi:hypothetical protein